MQMGFKTTTFELNLSVTKDKKLLKKVVNSWFYEN